MRSGKQRNPTETAAIISRAPTSRSGHTQLRPLFRQRTRVSVPYADRQVAPSSHIDIYIDLEARGIELQLQTTTPNRAKKPLSDRLKFLASYMMAESSKVAAAAEAGPVEEGRSKTVVLVAVDDSDHSYRALEWAVRHVAATAGAGAPVELVVVHAKPPPPPLVTLGGPGVSGDVVKYVEADLRKKAEEVVDKARRLCIANSVDGVVEVIDGDPRNVLCHAVEKHHADLLVVGSHGYGAIKRAFLGSVSDYCAHHAHCSVMIVKQPKFKN